MIGPRLLPVLLYTVFGLALSIIEVPSIAILEQAICVREFDNPSIEKAACKRSDVQSILNKTLGWKLTCSSLAGLLTALYYGSLAERSGKKLILSVSICGYMAMVASDLIICSFPFSFSAQTIWLSSALLLIGGGPRVYTSMVYALVADSNESSHRTTQLYLLGLGSNIGKLIGPRIGALLMQINLSTPFYISGIVFAIVLILVTLVTEGNEPVLDQQSGSYAPIPSRDSSEEHDVVTTGLATSDPPSPSDSDPPAGKSDRRTAFTLLKAESKAFCILFSTPATFYCLMAMFCKRIGFASSLFAPQYVSEKFKWSFQQTTWLRVSGSGAAILTYLVTPSLNTWLIKRGALPQTVDMKVIRGSLLVLAISFFGAWRADSGKLMIFATFGMGLGETLQPALQGFVTFATGSQRSTRVFTMLAVADVTAELVAGPFVAALMTVGMEDNSPSQGLCFLASSAIFMVLFLGTFLFGVSQVA